MQADEEKVLTPTAGTEPPETDAAEASEMSKPVEDDPWVGVQEGVEEPYLEPIEEEEKYVYQKGDFLALFLAALRVFAPVVLVFIAGIMLVYWFFAR